MPDHDESPPLNREQRRARDFGPAASSNPAVPGGGVGGGVTGGPEDVNEAHAGRPDQDQVTTVGAGAGGAVESDDRLRHHEGMNPPGNQPNS